MMTGRGGNSIENTGNVKFFYCHSCKNELKYRKMYSKNGMEIAGLKNWNLCSNY